MSVQINWTRRAILRLTGISDYIRQEFYPDYADTFEEDIAATVESLPENPRVGTEAFPSIHRPELRKTLSRSRTYWVYYRVKNSRLEILSIKHVLQQVEGPRNL